MANRIARLLTLGAVFALMVSSACSVSPTTIPPLTGPSGFALSFALTATPDSISQDGSSQSSITVTARDANAKSISGLAFRMDIFAGGVAVDYGRLSGKTIVTGSDGRANAVYTAPPAPPPGSTLGACAPLATGIPLPGTCVTISATPISTGFASGTVSQTVVIHLVPVGVILPPADTPTASFVVTPTPVSTNVAANFDASASCAGTATSGVCNSTSNTIVSYAWGFGDGGAAMGRTATHSYSVPGAYTVTLTVINDGGKSASATQTVTVGVSVLPVPNFTFSPAQPGVGDQVFFNGSTSTAGPGHTIVSYSWTFGDGGTGTGATVSHAYTAAGTYSVQLTVTDDIGQKVTSAPTTVTPGSPPTPKAAFTFSPNPPGRNDQVVFDASSSVTVQGQTIVDLAWNFGDGTPVIHCPGGAVTDCPGPTNRISTHTFALAQTFNVNLVVTDSAGRTSSTGGVPISVALAQPNVIITTSPGSPNPGTTVVFNSNGTTYFPGSGPGSFAWTFGDGATSTLANPTHPYAAVGAYSVGLSVTDTKGRTGTAVATVTVAAVTPPTPPAPPVAAFTFSPPAPALGGGASVTVNFDAGTSLRPSGAAITNYRWNFGDGSAVFNTASPTTTHPYTVAGAKTVTLIVTDANGLTGNTTQTVTVGP
jgi:PKD repeat protein